MNNLILTVGDYAGILALVTTVVLTLVVFSLSRDVRRLREWAGGAPERDSEVRELSEVVAEERAKELQVLAEREERRAIREGLVEPPFWERLGRGGRVMAIVAGILVLGAAGAWAGTTLLGGDDSPKPATKSKKAKNAKQAKAGALKPANIDVAVLNGTGGTETGLAAEYASNLENKGFMLGAVTDAPETFDSSVVMYTRGNEAAAKRVANAIGVSETALMTSDVATAAAGATVAAVIGTDHTALSTGG